MIEYKFSGITNFIDREFSLCIGSNLLPGWLSYLQERQRAEGRGQKERSINKNFSSGYKAQFRKRIVSSGKCREIQSVLASIPRF
jgi:hypothetical protein